MRDLILNEAKTLLVEEGILFKLDTLATSIKISKKTIYKHFKNKEEIIRVIINEAFDYTKGRQKDVLSSDVDLLTKIKSIMLISPLNEEMFSSTNMRNLKVHYPVLFQEVNDYFNSDWQVTYDLLDEAKELNLLKSFNNALFRHLYISGILFDYDYEISYQERLDTIINLLFEGIEL